MPKDAGYFAAVLVLVLVLGSCSSGGSQNCSLLLDGAGTPAIVFTYVPPIGSSNNLKGQVSHVVPANYDIVVYIRVEGGWWVKPFLDAPLTAINCDGTYTTDIDTGGIDTQADQIVAYLIPTSYSPPLLEGASALPPELAANSVAETSASR